MALTRFGGPLSRSLPETRTFTVEGPAHSLLLEPFRRRVRALVDDGVEAIAICFLNAFINGEHEARAKAIVQRVAPEAFVCTSSEVLPEIREYGGRVIRTSLSDDAEARLRERLGEAPAS